jgi:hypothetical protein
VFAHPAMAATVDKLSHDLYARPHATYVVPSTQLLNKDAAEAYVKRVPMSAKIKGNNLEPSERLRRTILRLNQAAIRRHVATKTDQPSKLH